MDTDLVMPSAGTAVIPAPHFDAGAPLEMEGMVRAALRAALPGAQLRQVTHVTRRGGLALVDRDGRPCVFKFIACTADWKKRWARRFGWNPARRAMEVSRALERAGFSVCPPLEWGEVSLPGAPRAVWTLTGYIPGGRTLRALKAELQPDRPAPEHPAVGRLFEKALEVLRGLHDAGFEHRDYHAGNLLVAPADERALESGAAGILLVDLETALRRAATLERRGRDLARFLLNFSTLATRGEMVDRALAVYASGDAGLAAALRSARRMRKFIRPE